MKHISCLKYLIKKDKPWLIIGKGPSFSRIKYIDTSLYYTFGLNHVSDIIRVNVAHAIDLDAIRGNCDYAIMPWRPHVKNKPGKELNKIVRDNKILADLALDGKLYFYELSTDKTQVPLIYAKYFSVEAAFNILKYFGIINIKTIGIDGGTKYAKEFSYLKPLTNGQSNFDKQFSQLTTPYEKL